MTSDRPAAPDAGPLPHRGLLVAVLGVVSLVVSPVGVIAWAVGIRDLRAMQARRMNPAGKPLTQVGTTLGVVGTLLFGVQLLFFALSAAGLVAVGPLPSSEEVRTYQPDPPANPAGTVAPGSADAAVGAVAGAAVAGLPDEAKPPRYRLLGAMIPRDDGTSWFVKFAGPVELIDPHAAEFDQFVASIRVPADPKGKLEYAAPPGWRPGRQADDRVVTFLAGPLGQAAEAYVSEPFGGDLYANVVRWRKEAGLGPVPPEAAAAYAATFTVGGRTAYKMDFRGPGPKPGAKKMPPFAGM